MILHEFVSRHRDEIIERARTRIGHRIAPIPTEIELSIGVGLFLDDLLVALAPTPSVGAAHGHQPMLRKGFTVAQVVYDYGDICQAVTELVGEHEATIDAREFRILNQTLDDAIAAAVTEFARVRDVGMTARQSEKLEVFATRLRTHLSTALLAFEAIQRGVVPTGGSTGVLIARSLSGLRRVIDQTMAEARQDGSAAPRERLSLAEVIEELEVTAAVEARGRGVRLATPRIDSALHVEASRDLLVTALSGLLLASIQVCPRAGLVTMSVETSDAKVFVVITVSAAQQAGSIEHEALAHASRNVAAFGASLQTEVVAGERRHRFALTSARFAS